MAYDETKDKLIDDLGRVPNTDIDAALRAYDGGEPKVVLTRSFTKKKDDTVRTRRLASFTLPQVVNLGEFLTAVAAKHGTGE